MKSKQCEASCGVWGVLLEKDIACQKTNCRLWIDFPEDKNCTNVAVYEHGSLTLAEVAKREGLSLSRIKQIEDSALKKLKKNKNFDF
jgi:hypothetical protein